MLPVVISPGVPIGLGIPAWSRQATGGPGGPPSGPAGGDLVGNYPNPQLVNVFAGGSFVFASITVDQKGRITAASNGVPTGGGGPPTGAAGGDLTGTYPNPTLVAVVAPGSFTYASITIDAAGRVTAAANGAPPVAPPSTLPPSGPAGGDLTGVYPNPTLVAVVAPGSFTYAAITIDAVGRVVAAASGTPPTFPGSLPPSGPAGGDLAGTYPNPTLAAVVSAGSFTYSAITIDAKGRVTAASSGTPPTFPASLPPSGPAGGDLAGTYPNPTLVNVFAGGSFTNSNITVDTKGRITAASNGSAGGGGSGAVNAGLIGQVGYYAAAGTAISGNAFATIDATGVLMLSRNATTPPVIAGTQIRMVQVDGTQNILLADSAATTGLNIQGRVVGGTMAAPTFTPGNTVLSQFAGRGWHNGGYSANQGYIQIITGAGVWSNTNAETYINFGLTPNGSTAITNIAILSGTGLAVTGNITATLGIAVVGGPKITPSWIEFHGASSVDAPIIYDAGGNALGIRWGPASGYNYAGFSPGIINFYTNTKVTGNLESTGQILSSNPAGDNNFLAGPFAPSFKMTDTIANPNGATRTTGFALATAAGHFGLNDGESMWWNLGANRGNIVIDPNYSGGGAARQVVVRSAMTVNSTFTVANGNAIVSAGNVIVQAGDVTAAGMISSTAYLGISPSPTVARPYMFAFGGTAYIGWVAASGVADQSIWDSLASASNLSFRTINDGYGAATTWLSVNRSGLTPTQATFSLPVTASGEIITGRGLVTRGSVVNAGANQFSADNLGLGQSRLLSWGVDPSTYGNLLLGVCSSNASIYLLPVNITAGGLAVTGITSTTGDFRGGAGGTSATASVLYLNGGSANGGGGYLMCQTNGTNQGIFGLNLGIGGGTNNPMIYAYGTNHIYMFGGGVLTADFYNGGVTITGQILATGNITAYYSDDRLKDRYGTIPNALEKVRCLEGFYYEANATAQRLGYKPKREVGLSAQRMQAVLPEIVAPAPIDPQYLTIHYERVTVLLVEALKELDQEFQAYKLAHP